MNDDINKKINEMSDNVVKLTTTLLDFKDNFIEFKNNNKEDHDEMKKDIKYTNGRVKGLEIWRARIIGALTVIVFLTGAFAFMFKAMVRDAVEDIVSRDYQLNIVQTYEN